MGQETQAARQYEFNQTDPRVSQAHLEEDEVQQKLLLFLLLV